MKWRHLIILCISMLSINQVFSAPAAGIEEQLLQPDGSIVNSVQKGDEWHSWTETTEGYAISQSDDGYWYYVTNYTGLQANTSQVRADSLPPADLQKSLQPAIERPAHSLGMGSESHPLPAPNGVFNGKVLFILAEFSDQAGTTTESSWGDFVSNNIADYFDKASYGKVTLQPATESYGISNNGVVGWVNLGYNHPNTGSSTGTANQTITKNAIIAADAYVDYSSYDSNSDGYVDADELAIVVITSGYERAYTSAYSPTVWGHKWSINSPPTVDGVIVGAYHSGAGGYAQFGENHATHQASMGIMVHELGHLIFAWPDLYDYDSSSSGIGAFGVMGGGSWGKKSSDTWAGDTPVLPTAWSLLKREWVTGAEGSGTETVTASGDSTATSSNTVYKASTSDSNQYFLVQNRQNVGYDSGLERYLGTGFTGGINIFHADDSQTLNTNDARRLVDVEEADGTAIGTGSGSNTDLWYAGNATTFDATSTPNSDIYVSTASGVDINSISATGTTMTVTFGSGGTVPDAATLISPTGTITDNTPTYTWDAVSNATSYYLWSNDSTGNKIKTWYTASAVGCASGTGTCSITPATSLADGAGVWWVQTWNAQGYGPWSSSMNFTVATSSVPGQATLVSPTGAITDSTPTYTWNAVSNATSYYLWSNDSTGNRVKTWYSASAAGCASGTGTCSITPTTSLADGAGVWWIQTWNLQGYGPWSSSMNFTVATSSVPGQATLVSPSGAITDNTPTYTWNAVPTATWYYLWSNDSTGNKIKTWYSASDAGCALGTGTCSITPTTSLADGIGIWWIQSWNIQGDGPWSAGMSFNLMTPP